MSDFEADKSKPKMEAAEAALIEVLAGLDAGGDLETLVAKFPEHREVLERRVTKLSGVGLAQLTNQDRIAIPGFDLIEVLGRGGMAEVWRARDLEHELDVALKIVRASTLATEVFARFERESDALTKLNHPGVVKIYAAGEESGFHWLAMELVEGPSLATRIEAGNLGAKESTRIALEVAEALVQAHALDLVHRDVKPQNILFRADGSTVLIDFGLARGVDPSSLTQSGGFLGTPHYAAPEQVRGDRHAVGPQTDIYGLGVTLYECLTGRRPFEAKNLDALFFEILNRDPRHPRALNQEIPRDLAVILAKSIEKNPAHRYATAALLADDLKAVLELTPIATRPISVFRIYWRRLQRRPALLVGVAVMLICLASALGYFYWQKFDRQAQRHQAAQAEMASARELLDTWLLEAGDLPQRMADFREARRKFERKYNSAAEIGAFDREQLAIERAQTRRDQVFAKVADALLRAEDLDPDIEGVARLRARLDVERWRVADQSLDELSARFFAERVTAAPGMDDLKQIVQPRFPIQVVTNPPGARVDAFVYRRFDHVFGRGGPRSILVPYLEPDHRHAGQLFLRVKRGSGELLAEDLILSLDGRAIEVADWKNAVGKSARVWRNGREFSSLINKGCVLRPTKRPLVHSQASYLGTTPINSRAINANRVVLLIRKDGYEPQRLGLPWTKEISSPLEVTLIPKGRHPVAFTRVHDYYGKASIYSDRELLCLEYAEFLKANDVEGKSGFLPEGWTIESSGDIKMPTDIEGDMPAYGFSWEAGQAYAKWASEKAQFAGRPYHFVMPEWKEWMASHRVKFQFDVYPWGQHYRAHYTKSCFANTKPKIESVLSYPVDETVLGIFDVAGGVSEFQRGWFWREKGQRPVAGGAWVYGHAIQFRLEFIKGTQEQNSSNFLGMRLQLIDPEYQ